MINAPNTQEMIGNTKKGHITQKKWLIGENTLALGLT